VSEHGVAHELSGSVALVTGAAGRLAQASAKPSLHRAATSPPAILAGPALDGLVAISGSATHPGLRRSPWMSPTLLQ